MAERRKNAHGKPRQEPKNYFYFSWHDLLASRTLRRLLLPLLAYLLDNLVVVVAVFSQLLVTLVKKSRVRVHTKVLEP